MEYRNTTDIPVELIEVVIKFCAQPGIEIKKLNLRNKAEGKMFGNWGWYQNSNKTISLIVPLEIPKNGVKMNLRYCGRHLTIKNRIEFVVTVLAHELRHAWQLQLQGLSYLNCLRASEVDAELYQIHILEQWREIVGE